MSTKGKKAGTPSSQGIPRPSSPLSPTRHSRLQEKADLQNLNDRLACYIEKVRYLEGENNRLSREIQCSQETVSREVSNIKLMYDHELSDARRLLDETHREKAKLEIDTKRLWDENEELRATLTKKTKDLSIAETSVRVLETRSNDLLHKANQAQSDAKKAFADAKELEKERDKLKKLVEELRKQLEEESLARVDVENNNQSLREELSFKDQIFQQQLTETRTRRQVDITEIDGRLAEQYEAKLQEALQDLRDQYEGQMANNRQEIEQLYETKIKNLQNAANRNSGAASAAIKELQTVRSRIDALNSRILELEGINARILEDERQRHAEDMALLEGELSRLRDEMAHQLQEYQDLMDIKVSLDLEIAAYRKLLESEEARLNITPHGGADSSMNSRTSRSSTSRTRTPVRGVTAGKRKRTLLDESKESSLADYSVTSSSKGDIQISDVCADGVFVKLYNKGSKEISIAGWQLVRRAGDNETVHKFHRSVKVEPKGKITIWSLGAHAEHEPPLSIVMKQQKWAIADNMTTTLINPNGEEVATSARVRKQLSSSASRHREYGHYLGAEDLHHQQGDPQGDEKCKLM